MYVVMEENITVLCYINSFIIYGPNGIEYIDRSQMAIRIKPETRFKELENKLCRVFHVDKSKNRLMIIYKYP